MINDINDNDDNSDGNNNKGICLRRAARRASSMPLVVACSCIDRTVYPSIDRSIYLFVYLFICLFIIVCVYIYIYIHMYMYICICICVYVCIYIYIYIYVHTSCGHCPYPHLSEESARLARDNYFNLPHASSSFVIV